MGYFGLSAWWGGEIGLSAGRASWWGGEQTGRGQPGAGQRVEADGPAQAGAGRGPFHQRVVDGNAEEQAGDLAEAESEVHRDEEADQQHAQQGGDGEVERGGRYEPAA